MPSNVSKACDLNMSLFITLDASRMDLSII
jgi:hypothetical protein